MRNVLVGCLLALCGCTTTGPTYLTNVAVVDGGASGCTPMALECVSATLARVCPADGSGWIGVPCAAGQTCSSGTCVPDLTMASCTPGSGSCVGLTGAMRCNASGVGFTAVTCPAGTQCTGKGDCAGACVVGETACDPATGALITCADGNTITAAACPQGQTCASVDGKAQCLGGDCQPPANGCSVVCGNKLDPKADQTRFTSQCVATPAGFKWQVTQCLSPQTCSPTAGGACSSTASNAACASQCLPGQTRCSPDGASIQTCGASGSWVAGATCNAAANQACVIDAGGQAVCGDGICAEGAAGVCVLAGGATLFRACGSDGKLGAPAPCALGVCEPDAMHALVAGLSPGVCVAQCRPGEQQCVGNNAYQTCGANGTWKSAVTQCPSADGAPSSCFAFTQPSGALATVCGACRPGSHRCANSGGGLDGGAGMLNELETCDSTGRWGAATPCTVGVCAPSGANDVACVAQCIPGSTLCVGQSASVPGTPYQGSEASVACTAQGMIPAFTGGSCASDPNGPGCCGAGTLCRQDSAGNALGCLACVGTSNEAGLVDTRCVDGNGVAPGTASIETCSASNSWGAPTMCASPEECRPATGNQASPTVCGSCYGRPSCTDSALFTTSSGAFNCEWLGLGPPRSCGGQPDCCASACSVGPAPAPAVCSSP